MNRHILVVEDQEDNRQTVQANSSQRLTLSNAASRRLCAPKICWRSGKPDRVYFSLSAIIPSMSRMQPSRMISFRLRISAAAVVAQRVSIRTLRPMIQPDCASPLQQAMAGLQWLIRLPHRR